MCVYTIFRLGTTTFAINGVASNDDVNSKMKALKAVLLI